jgi:hypothetical protein
VISFYGALQLGRFGKLEIACKPGAEFGGFHFVLSS